MEYGDERANFKLIKKNFNPIVRHLINFYMLDKN
tara:strand:- start:557 stop:658 length:102 start_codon:yes stop_codon:yes gene_type:complete